VSDPTTVKAITNTTPNSCVVVTCDCNTMWSLVQQLTYQRLSVSTGELKGKLVRDYAVRARRIAATYARFYLEQEKGCDPSKKGRFYWMALGAFASKTVACALEDPRVRLQPPNQTIDLQKVKEKLGSAGDFLPKDIGISPGLDKVKQSLAKGNFWLFSDISAWHWYYTIYPTSFEKCLESRNAQNYVPAVKTQLSKLPWNAEALPKIKQMVVSEHVKKGFAKVKEFEAATVPKKKLEHQLKHLLAIADHEQGVILQPLIYDDKEFVKWLERQRNPPFSWVSPDLELVFSSECSTDQSELKSVAPEDTKLENLESRMDWIGNAAKQFHDLMQKRPSYMEAEIQNIAGWASLADK
jgi:hypothetical protein